MLPFCGRNPLRCLRGKCPCLNQFSHAQSVVIHCSLGKLSQIHVLGHNAGLNLVALCVGLTSRALPSFFCHGMKTEQKHWLGQNWLSPHCLAQHEAKLNPHQFRIGGEEGHQNKTTTTKIKIKINCILESFQA